MASRTFLLVIVTVGFVSVWSSDQKQQADVIALRKVQSSGWVRSEQRRQSQLIGPMHAATSLFAPRGRGLQQARPELPDGLPTGIYRLLKQDGSCQTVVVTAHDLSDLRITRSEQAARCIDLRQNGERWFLIRLGDAPRTGPAVGMSLDDDARRPQRY